MSGETPPERPDPVESSMAYILRHPLYSTALQRIDEMEIVMFVNTILDDPDVMREIGFDAEDVDRESLIRAVKRVRNFRARKSQVEASDEELPTKQPSPMEITSSLVPAQRRGCLHGFWRLFGGR